MFEAWEGFSDFSKKPVLENRSRITYTKYQPLPATIYKLLQAPTKTKKILVEPVRRLGSYIVFFRTEFVYTRYNYNLRPEKNVLSFPVVQISYINNLSSTKLFLLTFAFLKNILDFRRFFRDGVCITQ
jgi:hypothetical protein